MPTNFLKIPQNVAKIPQIFENAHKLKIQKNDKIEF